MQKNHVSNSNDCGLFQNVYLSIKKGSQLQNRTAFYEFLNSHCVLTYSNWQYNMHKKL